MDNNFRIHYLYTPDPIAPTQNHHQLLAREDSDPVTFEAPDVIQSWVGVPSQYWPFSSASQGTNTIGAAFEANPTAQVPRAYNHLRCATFPSPIAERQVFLLNPFELPEVAPILRGSNTRMATDPGPKSKVTRSKAKPREVSETDPTKRLKACANCRKAKTGCVKGRNKGDPCRRCTRRGNPCELVYPKIYVPRDEGEDPAIEDSDVQDEM
ncbi:hypothetical protein E4T47_03006 [Aureobasidium subglaciale]|nr:hypothetical protein E4T47_03006 [Aureobasidium subglaciale]